MELAETDSHLRLELTAGVLRVHLLGALPHRDPVLGGAGDFLLQAQFVKDAAVKLLLGTTAVEKGLVVVLEAVDVSLELLHAVGVDILDNASSAAGNLTTLFQAVELAAAVRLVLALHVIIVESLAAGADSEGRTSQECRCGTNLLDLWDMVGHRRGVHEELLVELGISLGHDDGGLSGQGTLVGWGSAIEAGLGRAAGLRVRKVGFFGRELIGWCQVIK